MSQYYISKPKFTKVRDGDDNWAIPLISVFLLLIATGILLWLIRRDVNVESPTQAKFVCGKGQCPTNYYNGVKRCPSGEEELEYDPTIEVCNGKYVCDDPVTGFAVLNNQGTMKKGLHEGTCEPHVECRCVRFPQCPDYVTAYYRITGGTPYTTEDGTTLSYNQRLTYKLPYENSKGNAEEKEFSIPPLVLPDASKDVCFIGESALDISYPSECIRGVRGEILDNNGNSQRFKEFACVQERITCPSGKMIGISEDGKITKCV
jgi:hypothetical protein